MKRLSIAAAALFVCSAAYADGGFDHVSEGAAFYGALRPAPMMRLLKRLQVDQLPAVIQLRQKAAGIDFLDPAILGPAGVDGDAPSVAAVEVWTKEGLTHVRVAVPLRDANLFRLFMTGLTASGKLVTVAADSPEGKLGIVAQTPLPDSATGIVRIDGNTGLFDVVDTWNDKPVTALSIAKHWPPAVTQPFIGGNGARQLFSPDAPLTLYVDARRFSDVLEGFSRGKNEDDIAAAAAPARAKLKAQRAKELKGCLADWKRAPATFDDAALAVTAQPKGVKVTLGWGKAAGPVPLHFAPAVDVGVDLRALGQAMPLVVTLFAASVQPFAGLPHDGIYAGTDKLRDFTDRCSDVSALGIFLRGWPNLAASGAAQLSSTTLQQQMGPRAPLLGAVGSLRCVVVGVADQKGSAAAVAIGLSSADQRPLIEGLGALVGAKATPRTFGTRQVSYYSTDAASSLGAIGGALESRPDGGLLVSVASSEAALMNLYRGGSTTIANPPLLSAHFDKRFLSQLDVSGNPDLAQIVAKMTTIDGEIRSDDLFRVSVVAPYLQ